MNLGRDESGDCAGVTAPGPVTTAASRGVVLSLFPGADLLGRGFEMEGFCVVRGPDRILGGDIREFRGRRRVFEGVIGGPPCQDFSRARRGEPTGYGMAMLAEFCRVIEECAPSWWLMENVPTVPDVAVNEFTVQRFDLRADEFGLGQARIRHFQWGTRNDWERLVIPRGTREPGASRVAMASEGRRKNRRSFADFCGLQGVAPLESPWLTKAGRYGVVGNAVPLPMARAVARAISARSSVTGEQVRACACGCGRRLDSATKLMARAACRKRMQRRRDSAIAGTHRAVTSRDLRAPEGHTE